MIVNDQGVYRDLDTQATKRPRVESLGLRGRSASSSTTTTMLFLDGNSEAEHENENEHQFVYTRWTQRESVFLVGIVLDTFYRRHSLGNIHANTKEKKKDKVWEEIEARYTEACRRYEVMHGEATPPRTLLALQRHWKNLARNNDGNSHAGHFGSETRTLERVWEEQYDIDRMLSCSKRRFEENLPSYNRN